MVRHVGPYGGSISHWWTVSITLAGAWPLPSWMFRAQEVGTDLAGSSWKFASPLLKSTTTPSAFGLPSRVRPAAAQPAQTCAPRGIHGDVHPRGAPNGRVELGDVLYVLSAYSSANPMVDFPGADLAPCQANQIGNGILELSDVLAALDAYDGHPICRVCDCGTSTYTCGDSLVCNGQETLRCDNTGYSCTPGAPLLCGEDGFTCTTQERCSESSAGCIATRNHAFCPAGSRCEPDDPSAHPVTGCLSRCGDGTAQLGEMCDDGNTLDGDGCSRVCLFESPVRLMGEVNRMDPAVSISDAEMSVLATRYDFLAGLDGHGYQLPGAISRLRELNATLPVLCFADTMDILPNTGDDRAVMDLEEDAFFHSADPASLRVILGSGRAVLWFKQDARARYVHNYYTPPGVDYYVVESSGSAQGPWSSLGQPIHEDGIGDLREEAGMAIYTFTDTAPSATKWYRVRSKIAGRVTPVAFSWPAQAEQATEALPIVVLAPDGYFAVIYVGPHTPRSEDVILARDLNRNRVLGEDHELDAAESRIIESDYKLYYGEVNKPSWRTAYRAYLRQAPSVSVPLIGDSFTAQNSYNNRLQNKYGAHLLKPDHGLWKDLMQARLERCLDSGFNGIRLDFTHDTLRPPWIANAPVSIREQETHARLPELVSDFLSSLGESAPEAAILFNGYFVTQDKNNYVEYLTHTHAADIEYFAFDSPDSQTVLSNVFDAFEGIVQARFLGNAAIATVSTDRENTVSRMMSLALYLLIADELTFLWNAGDGSFQDIPYFPEWDVPLGRALVAPVQELSDILDPRGVLRRDFENGVVFVNPEESVVTLNLPELLFLLSVSGGYDPVLGGDGAATYTEVTQIELAGEKEAILVRRRP